LTAIDRQTQGSPCTEADCARCLRQVLYQTLSQPNIDLDWPRCSAGFALSDAISHSLATPGALLHSYIREKAGRFGAGGLRTMYLRVTLGLNKGASAARSNGVQPGMASDRAWRRVACRIAHHSIWGFWFMGSKAGRGVCLPPPMIPSVCVTV
jgi:hypothetical protein